MTSFPNTSPGLSAARTAAHRRVLVTENGALRLPTSKLVKGSVSRDPGNTGNVDVLRAGVLLGKITASGLYAPSVIGLLDEAVDNAETAIDIPSAVATEITRRIGSSGTCKFIGPPTAAGTVRALTVTYSAVGASSMTITSPTVNEVQTLTFGAAATGGTMRLIVPKADGTLAITDAITWNGTDATWLSNINTALDGATGVSGGIVATGGSPDTTLIFTFSGTGFTGLSHTLIQVHTFPTSCTTANVVRTTTGVDGRFVTGSIIAPTDGSESPVAIIGDGYGLKVTDIDGASMDTQIADLLVGGIIDPTKIINYPADTALRQYLKDLLNNTADCKFIFSDKF